MITIHSRARAKRPLVIVLLLLSLLCGQAAAQQPAPPSPPAQRGETNEPIPGIGDIVHSIVGDFRALPSRDNIVPATMGAGFTLAVHPADDDLNRHLEGSGGVNDFYFTGKVLGEIAFQAGAAGVVYAIGRIEDRPRVAILGADLLRAQAVNAALTLALKEIVRRERPDGSNNQSFPSGHASVSFAAATVLTRHFGWRVAIPAYAVAAYTATSRLHENKHFLSDIVAGAAVGYVSARTVMRHGRPMYACVPVFEHRGVEFVVTRTW